MSISVITATMLPERSHRLAEAVASVQAQTLRPDEHLIGVDFRRTGGARIYNQLAAGADGDWLAILPDDDVLFPDHLASLIELGGDVAYSWAEVTGPDPWTAYNQPFDPELLRRLSIVSHVALVRTELVLDLGGWDEVQGYDWLFWVKALDAGATFRCLERPTWRYRLDAGEWHESRPWLAA